MPLRPSLRRYPFIAGLAPACSSMSVRAFAASGRGNVVAAQVVQVDMFTAGHRGLHRTDRCAIFEDARISRNRATRELVPQLDRGWHEYALSVDIHALASRDS